MERAMEYYIYTTYSCNMKCSYCLAKRVIKRKGNLSKLDNNQLESIINYIRSDITKRKTVDNSIVFFGGEPSLVPETMRDIIEKTQDLSLKYLCYINGLNIDGFSRELLNSMNCIFVSIDGDKKTHEKYRGKGTYDRILRNTEILRSRGNAHLMARITLEEDANIYRSVTNLLDFFDSFYWQIVNKPKFNSPEVFINNYKNNVRELFEYWYSKFEAGEVLRIIPFQAIIQAMLFENDSHNLSFRCGSGSELQVIDMGGNVYECDEYIGDLSRCIGNINNGSYPTLSYESHKEIFEGCRSCNISEICLGRCRRCLKIYDKEHISNYCELTKRLIEFISEYIPKIRNVVRIKKLTPEKIYDGPYCTEEIP